ncbi:hypothetical protein CISIN_1g035099mg [Citrus sinensis]|uniref:Uncharacterized protein n=1 Tax=Citrus sinensis TaxID=2711 RepID=A0A067D847_CITSI|nr:hypothetical protein CISIN_1g035099mg [Citrus sinensis]
MLFFFLHHSLLNFFFLFGNYHTVPGENITSTTSVAFLFKEKKRYNHYYLNFLIHSIYSIPIFLFYKKERFMLR